MVLHQTERMLGSLQEYDRHGTLADTRAGPELSEHSERSNFVLTWMMEAAVFYSTHHKCSQRSSSHPMPSH